MDIDWEIIKPTYLFKMYHVVLMEVSLFYHLIGVTLESNTERYQIKTQLRRIKLWRVKTCTNCSEVEKTPSHRALHSAVSFFLIWPRKIRLLQLYPFMKTEITIQPLNFYCSLKFCKRTSNWLHDCGYILVNQTNWFITIKTPFPSHVMFEWKN